MRLRSLSSFSQSAIIARMRAVFPMRSIIRASSSARFCSGVVVSSILAE